MKKIFCILSLAFFALSVVFGVVYLALLVMDMIGKVKSGKETALQKLKDYLAETDGKPEIQEI